MSLSYFPMHRRRIQTKGGRHSSAGCFGTENPPCVLVSEGVSFLLKEHILTFDGEGREVASAKLGSSS